MTMIQWAGKKVFTTKKNKRSRAIDAAHNAYKRKKANTRTYCTYCTYTNEESFCLYDRRWATAFNHPQPSTHGSNAGQCTAARYRLRLENLYNTMGTTANYWRKILAVPCSRPFRQQSYFAYIYDICIELYRTIYASTIAHKTKPCRRVRNFYSWK